MNEYETKCEFGTVPQLSINSKEFAVLYIFLHCVDSKIHYRRYTMY